MRYTSVRLLSDIRVFAAPCCRCTFTTSTAQPVEAVQSTSGKSILEIPGPDGIYNLPYFGFRLHFKPFSNYDMTLMNEKFEAWKNQYGPIVRVKLGKAWAVYLFDPDDIEKVFRSDNKYPERPTLPLITIYDKRQKNAPSLASSLGEDWYAMRAPTQRTMLRPKAVTKYAPKISKIADDFVDSLKNSDRLENLPFKLMEYSAEGVGMLCFNTRLGCITSDNTITPLMSYTQQYLFYAGNSVYKVIPTYMMYKNSYYKKFEEAADFLHNEADSHINKAMADLKHASDNGIELESNLLFDLLSTPGLTPELVRRTMTDVFIGGIDSTANTMTFMLFNLAKNPEKQERLFQELKEHVPMKGEIQEDTINKMPYLKACLRESFRLVFPISGGTVRILDKDIMLKGYNIPKKTPIQLCSGIIGRDEQYFPQQDQFIPERWLRGNTRTDVNPFAHLPFGFGPRKCIGQRFAEQEIYICASKLLRSYRVVLPPGMTDVPFYYCVFATPKEPVSFLLEKRQQ